MRTARLLAPLAVLALLAGCSGDPAEAEPTSQAPQAEQTRDKVAPERAEDEPADDDAPSGDLATCIVGEWTADAAAVAAASDATMAEMGMSSTTVVTGESFTTIEPTTISTTYVDQVSEMTITAEGQTIVSTTRMNGTVSQSYTLDGDVLMSVAGDLSGVQIESSVLVNGQELPGYEEGFQQGLSSGTAAGQAGRNRVSCSGDTMTMTTLDMASIGMAEITVAMTRR